MHDPCYRFAFATLGAVCLVTSAADAVRQAWRKIRECKILLSLPLEMYFAYMLKVVV